MRRECLNFINPTWVLLFLALFALLGATDAHAQCSSPSGVAADLKFNSSHNVLQYCDGTDWKAMGPSPDCTGNWAAIAAPEANGWSGVAYGNGMFVATASTGTNRIMTSPDGVNWTARAAPEANQWFRINVSALPPPMGPRVDYSTKFQGMSSSMSRCMC
jgi:hypothetical protein